MKLLALLRNKICPFGKQADAGGISRCFSCRGFRLTEQSERRYDQRRQGVSSPAWAADGPRTRCTLWKHNSEVTDIEKHTHTHTPECQYTTKSSHMCPDQCLTRPHTTTIHCRMWIAYWEKVNKHVWVGSRFNAANKVMDPLREAKCSPLDLGSAPHKVMILNGVIIWDHILTGVMHCDEMYICSAELLIKSV